MPNDDSRDPSPIPRSYGMKWLLGGVYVAVISIISLVIVWNFGWFDRALKLDPAPEVLGRAPWNGEVTSDFKRAVPLLDSAIRDTNRVVVTVREGMLFHMTEDSIWSGASGVVQLSPCRVHEVQDPLLLDDHAWAQELIFNMKQTKATDFDHNDKQEYDLIFHFYKDEKLLVVLGWIGGFDVIDGWTGKPPPSYLRWFDGGWQGDVALLGTEVKMINLIIPYGLRFKSTLWRSVG